MFAKWTSRGNTITIILSAARCRHICQITPVLGTRLKISFHATPLRICLLREAVNGLKYDRQKDRGTSKS
jgi:hypothetical protein